MEYLGEVARRAHVSVETVLRVLNGDSASGEVRARVADALDALGVPLRAPAGADSAQPVVTFEEPRHQRRAEVGRSAVDLGLAGGEEVEAIIREVLHQELSPLAGESESIRRELSEERGRRLSDLAHLVELIVTGWQTVDARLARIEALLSTGNTPPAAVEAIQPVAAAKVQENAHEWIDDRGQPPASRK